MLLVYKTLYLFVDPHDLYTLRTGHFRIRVLFGPCPFDASSLDPLPLVPLRSNNFDALLKLSPLMPFSDPLPLLSFY